ncbi:MAG: hypothetical protein NTY03_00710 [Candidatus Bathyarchaeota archaeon]|nr:hypothetical protein [Candidatus Bathyarchaeota archaeon]
MQPSPATSDTNWLTRPLSRNEGRLLILATLAISIDCITTLFFQITKTGTESNSILRKLM